MNSNILTKPLAQFHTQFVSVMDELPQNGKKFEITKRILIVVVSPFAYLGLGFLSLAGQLYDSLFKGKKVVNSSVNTLEIINLAKQSLLFEITNAKAINEIQSGKFFFNVVSSGNTFEHSFIKDFIIKPIDKSEFDNDFLTQKIESIMNELKELIQVDKISELSINWEVLLKDKNVNFTRVFGIINKRSNYFANFRDIPSDLAQKTFDVTLKRLNREIKPQLDDQSEFI